MNRVATSTFRTASDIPDLAWPRRRQFLGIALFVTAAAIYGSLVPLEPRPMALSEAIRRFGQISYLSLTIHSRADWVANVLLFVPISFCWLAVFTVDRGADALRCLLVPLVVVGCAALGVLLEFTQLWFPPRTVSLNDILAETLGAVIGAALWLLIGQVTVEWIRSYTRARRPSEQLDWLLGAYFVGLVIYSILPLDLTISPAELVRKYRADRIALLPFSDVSWGLFGLYGLARDVVVFVPVGMLAATWLTPPERPVRGLGTSVLLGGLAAAGLELAQLLVFSRFAATGDVITGTLGVLCGAWIMRRWRGAGERDLGPLATHTSLRRTWLWLAAAALYVGLLFVVFCAPFDPIDDLPELKARFRGFLRVPFAALYRGSEFNAVSEVLKKGLFFAPLGAVLAMTVVSLPVPRPIRRILLVGLWMAAAGVAVAIEMAQVFLPPHVPDVTDVLLCSAGAAVGMLLTVRITDARVGGLGATEE